MKQILSDKGKPMKRLSLLLAIALLGFVTAEAFGQDGDVVEVQTFGEQAFQALKANWIPIAIGILITALPSIIRAIAAKDIGLLLSIFATSIAKFFEKNKSQAITQLRGNGYTVIEPDGTDNGGDKKHDKEDFMKNCRCVVHCCGSLKECPPAENIAASIRQHAWTVDEELEKNKANG